jgi:hypothetical protein
MRPTTKIMLVEMIRALKAILAAFEKWVHAHD